MQIYLRYYYLYDFYQQKALEARYKAKNPQANQKYKKHNVYNIEHGDNTLAKS